ncbi:hypothetical protein NPX13_g10435 [Xylaria arbuscula]|uniref:Uncharacterized protein n=1 Tax=Xylaria arbuscula TaxID=114810 RepID=A0A9W8N4L0_9PEZI|nr:hypothetical protein NPX13_g10435 [Xylaria arbuscula]
MPQVPSFTSNRIYMGRESTSDPAPKRMTPTLPYVTATGPNCDRLEALRDEEIQKANESLMQDEQGPLASPDDPPLSFASSQRTLTQFRLNSNNASSFDNSDTSANELAMEVPSTKRTKRRGQRSADTDSEASVYN